MIEHLSTLSNGLDVVYFIRNYKLSLAPTFRAEGVHIQHLSACTLPLCAVVKLLPVVPLLPPVLLLMRLASATTANRHQHATAWDSAGLLDHLLSLGFISPEVSTDKKVN